MFKILTNLTSSQHGCLDYRSPYQEEKNKKILNIRKIKGVVLINNVQQLNFATTNAFQHHFVLNVQENER